ncbi:hypothetical protein CWI82_07450 [Pseudidiomarina tainanensis]|jgi:hypothetical protein|uniref:Uncharacterized protein n=2 Tax=Pseudidiomarina TaxID=2800384 RepID=A0A1I6G6J2_9GAMM|nr:MULTISPECIES: hypothetical protein [Pseudidiomarina]RZQ57094.1 hypothetical protein CWI82_07450 [Pseudidiomarina tainanensis]SFR37818.1 hypothetical protein SAMN04488070_0232 [Pseudidiomarina maritima]
MTTKQEQQLQQKWQQYVAAEAEHVDITFYAPQQNQSPHRLKTQIKPMWLSAAALVMTIGITWWLSFLPVPTVDDSSVVDDSRVPTDSSQPMLLASNYRLDALERRIQQAYLQGASEVELAQLWQQHQALTN